MDHKQHRLFTNNQHFCFEPSLGTLTFSKEPFRFRFFFLHFHTSRYYNLPVFNRYSTPFYFCMSHVSVSDGQMFEMIGLFSCQSSWRIFIIIVYVFERPSTLAIFNISGQLHTFLTSLNFNFVFTHRYFVVVTFEIGYEKFVRRSITTNSWY